MANGKFVAYFRVSTDQQGRSGLGLEAQRKAVLDYMAQGGWAMVQEFTEVESGKSAKNRPQLTAALALCRKQKATLVIARLDRLSRNAAFLLALRDSGVEVRACDMPQAGTLEFGIRAVIAQHEREQISSRTKAALAAAKARGTELGRTGKALAKKNRAAANDHARKIAKQVRALQAEHPSLRKLTAALNEAKVPTATGAKWHPTSVVRLLERLG